MEEAKELLKQGISCAKIVNTLEPEQSFKKKESFRKAVQRWKKAYVWRRWGQNVYSDQLIENQWKVITWSAKWLFDDNVMNCAMTPKEVEAGDDKRVVKAIWELINEADVVIAHNGLKFDNKMLNGRFFIHGMNPPSSYQTIDTLRHARKKFSLPSNSLNDIAHYLDTGEKIKTDFSWWKEFLDGDEVAIEKMVKYNDKDVTLLEEIYLRMRPWITPHPNLSLFIDDDKMVCPTCESSKLQYNGEYSTYANTYTEYQCKNCGNSCRANKKHTKLTPLPR